MQDSVNQLLEKAQAEMAGGGALPGAGGSLMDQMPSWMPPAGVIVAAAAVGVGVVVWLLGGKLIKPGFVLVGGVVGSAFGAVYMPSLTASIAGIPAAYPGMAIGLVLGMILAVIVYRFAIASLAAGVLGAAALLATIVALGSVPGAIPPATAIEHQQGKTVIRADGTEETIRDQVETQVRDWSGRLKDAAQKYKDAQLLAGAGAGKDLAASGQPATGGAGATNMTEEDAQRIEAAKRTAQAISDHIAQRWQSLPDRTRLALAGAWMAGAMLGFLLGLLLPKKAAAAICSLTGAAMLLAGSASLAGHYTGLGPQLAGISAMGWLGAWMVLSAVGLLVQSRKSGKNQTPAPQGAPVAA